MIGKLVKKLRSNPILAIVLGFILYKLYNARRGGARSESRGGFRGGSVCDGLLGPIKAYGYACCAGEYNIPVLIYAQSCRGPGPSYITRWRYGMNDQSSIAWTSFNYLDFPTLNTSNFAINQSSNYCQLQMVEIFNNGILPSGSIPPPQYNYCCTCSNNGDCLEQDVCCDNARCFDNHGRVGICNEWCCFPANATVILKDGGEKKVSELNIGDEVMTMNSDNITYSKITTFLHKNEKQEAIFTKLSLSNGKDTTVSPKHLIYVNGEYATADSVKVGDKVEFIEDEVTEIMVEKVKEVRGEGIYAPLTETGTIVVNNVHYSCYAEYDIMKDIKGSHNLANVMMTPLRSCGTFSKMEGEVHWYAKLLMSLVA